MSLHRNWSIHISRPSQALDSISSWLCRFCDGITSGMVTLTATTYATEISNTTIRGTVTATTCLLFLFGASICTALGLVMTWYEVALRGNHINIEIEMALLKKINSEGRGDKSWSFLLQRKVRKRILVLSVLFLVQGFSGTAALRANAVRILQASGVVGNTNMFATILMLVPIAGVFVLTWKADSLGRRWYLVISLALMMITYVVLGTAVYLQTPSFVSVVPTQLNGTVLPPSYHRDVRSVWEVNIIYHKHLKCGHINRVAKKKRWRVLAKLSFFLP